MTCFSVVYCFIVLLYLFCPQHYIIYFHTLVAPFCLVLLKVPLNTNQPTNQPCLAWSVEMRIGWWVVHMVLPKTIKFGMVTWEKACLYGVDPKKIPLHMLIPFLLEQPTREQAYFYGWTCPVNLSGKEPSPQLFVTCYMPVFLLTSIMLHNVPGISHCNTEWKICVTPIYSLLKITYTWKLQSVCCRVSVYKWTTVRLYYRFT